MATLAQITRETRLLTKISVIVGVVLFFFFLFFQGANVIKSIFFPPPPPLPQVAYGVLDPISFPPSNSSTLQYNLNTIQGNLPATIPDRMRVYSIKNPETNVIALPNARNKVKNLGFFGPGIALSPTLYQWTNNNTQTTIKYDILSENFDLSSAYLGNKATISATPLPSSEQIIYKISEFLKNLNENATDINFTDPIISYFKVQNTILLDSTAEDAQVARLDFFQNDLEIEPITIFQNKLGRLKLFYPKLNKSLINFYVVSTVNGPTIAEAHYNHKLIDRTNYSTYPIKTPAEAYEELKKGNAYTINSSTLNTIDITDVALGYYIDDNTINALQPIYIFLGKDFMAYVPAVNRERTKEIVKLKEEKARQSQKNAP